MTGREKLRGEKYALLFLIAAVFTAGNLLYYRMDNSFAVKEGFKAIIDFACILLACAIRARTRGRRSNVLLWGVVCYALADAVINFSFFAGMGLFAVGHVVLVAGLWRFHRPGKGRVIFFALFSAAAVTGILLARSLLGSVAVPAAVYAVFLIAMLTACLGGGAVLRTAGILFTISDILLAYNMAGFLTVFTEVTVLFTFFLAVILLCFAIEER